MFRSRFLFVCVLSCFFSFFSTATIDSSVRCHFKTYSWLNSLIDRNNRNSMWVYRLPVWQTGFFKLIDKRHWDGMRHWTIELLKNAWYAFDFHVSIEKREEKKQQRGYWFCHRGRIYTNTFRFENELTIIMIW